MGNCKSAHTIDVLCNHNKPHIAICLGNMCTRDEGDRRLCEECLVDHMCTDRITIDDAIKYDEHQIKPVIEKFERDQTSSEALGGLSQTLANFKNHFFESLKSYQTYYDIYLNQFLLTGIPDAELFGEAASQIADAYEKNDLGYIQKQGLQILLNTYKEPSLIKLIIGNLDASSKKLSIYLTQVELKLKRLQENFCLELQTLPSKLNNENTFMNSMMEIDSKLYNYEFSAYLTTVDTSRGNGAIIQLNCSEHNQKIQVICCDKCPNKDIRLCGQCLITHKCNVGQRIKLKSFAQDQQYIIEASKKYLKKVADIQEVKQKVRRAFEEIMRQIVKEIELVGQNSKRMMCESQLNGFDNQIKCTKQYFSVVFSNGSMVSLDARGVAIIAYLIQHEEVKQQLLSFDVKSNAIQYLNKLVIQLEELGKRFLQNISQVEDIAQFEKKPSQNLEQSIIATTPVMATTIGGGTLNRTISKQPSFQLSLKSDTIFENKIDSCPVTRVLKDFGEDQDNFVSDLIYFDKYLMVSTAEGLIVWYEGLGEKKIAEYQFEAKCTSICGFYYNDLPACATCVGTYEEHKIGILVYNNNYLNLKGYLEGHSDPILKVKQLIRPEVLVSCSGDHTIRIWDTKQAGILENVKPKVITNHKMAVRDVILICSNLLVTGSFDETIQIYDLKTDKIVYAQQFEDWIYCLQNLTEKAFLIGTGAGDIIVMNTQNFCEIQRIRIAPSYVNAIMVFNNPNYLFVSCKNRDNYIIRLQEYRQIDYITKIEDVDFVPEGILIIDNNLIYGEANSVKIKNAD